MNKLLFYLIGFAIFIITNASTSAKHEINFKPVKGYMFTGPESELSMMFLAIKNEEEWQQNFQPYPGHHTLETTTLNFNDFVAIALIKNGYTYWQLNPKKVSVDEGDITFEYDAFLTDKNLSWKAAIPLIVLIPKSNYKSIQFIENGSIIKKIENFTGSRFQD